MFAFLEKLLPEILGLENFPGPLVIERAHRISRFSEDRSDSPLRAVIMKFLNYADKVHTLKASRAKCTVRVDKRKLMFFSDMSAASSYFLRDIQGKVPLVGQTSRRSEGLV